MGKTYLNIKCENIMQILPGDNGGLFVTLMGVDSEDILSKFGEYEIREYAAKIGYKLIENETGAFDLYPFDEEPEIHQPAEENAGDGGE